ncbi:hypothetical protein VTJ04DRAFT_8857 [Mycothermus thermophilus]|uniref:uncharacterized protein n=1 Tax=Humicola insolens TaxID=85995 RepID=UPI0037436FBE
MSNPNALLLLADHIKLSLLEQQRAKTLNLPRDSQDGRISRSLDQFREGLEALEREQHRLREAGDESRPLHLPRALPSPSLRGQLFPYRDDPDTPGPRLVDDDSAGYRAEIDARNMSNVQIHAYHDQILREQDAQLDALGASIARQRELSERIGDELESQVLLLDESDRAADRQASALARARRHVGRVARGAAESGEGRQMGAIVLLIVVLVLLIVILNLCSPRQPPQTLFVFNLESSDPLINPDHAKIGNNHLGPD